MGSTIIGFLGLDGSFASHPIPRESPERLFKILSIGTTVLDQLGIYVELSESVNVLFQATMVCMDNSEWMRNGDYLPTRFQAQADAVNLICGAKTQVMSQHEQ